MLHLAAPPLILSYDIERCRGYTALVGCSQGDDKFQTKNACLLIIPTVLASPITCIDVRNTPPHVVKAGLLP